MADGVRPDLGERVKVSAVVIDIEGTTSPTAFVTDRMYAYSRDRFANWLAEHATEPDTARAIRQVCELTGEPDASVARIVAVLNGWLDDDRKVTPLKTIQGKIWQRGFADGDLVAPFFPDVIPALRAWHSAGLALYIYSSGSVGAQRAWFAHTTEGDLLSLLSGHFDTENAGPKTAAASYHAIVAATGRVPREIVFLSDLAAELDAARAAGWHTVAVSRPGEPHFAALGDGHHKVDSFGDLDLSPLTSR